MLGFNLDALCGSPGSQGDVILGAEVSERSPQVGTDQFKFKGSLGGPARAGEDPTRLATFRAFKVIRS